MALPLKEERQQLIVETVRDNRQATVTELGTTGRPLLPS
jgi:DeoR/GlpR family transcriptional regulator of sugar metabolism